MIEYDMNIFRLGGKDFVFDNNILGIVSIENKIIVVFETDEDDGYDNVYCYNFNQEKIWRIQQPPTKIGGTARVPYVGIGIEDGECKVVDFFGRKFSININDGSIISKEIVR